MSGTSLDGVDLVYVKFNKKKGYAFKILFSETIAYSKHWKSTLQNAIYLSADDLVALDIVYGEFLGDVIQKFTEKFSIKNIDFIASHGHTVLHEPHKGITLQIGSGQKIATITKQKVVCDFRTQDVQLGGQGAPLVPIGDALLFADYDYCLNLGGFANISFTKNNQRIAFDICPVNIVLNMYAKKLGLDFDDAGTIAASGSTIIGLKKELQEIAFYAQSPPKSLGLEWVKTEIFPRIELQKSNPKDVLRTFTEHVAWAISEIIPTNAKVLVTGGGAYNTYLISLLKAKKNANFILPEKRIIEFKEALIFAFLGLLRLDNQVNCLSSVTGAKKDHSSGEIFYL